MSELLATCQFPQACQSVVLTKYDSSGVLGGIMVQAPSDGGDSAGHKVCGDVINCNVASTDGCHFTTGNKTYVARCETDLYGSDFENIETLSLTACVKQCSKKSACKSVSWSLGRCYLKNEIPDALYSKVYGCKSHKVQSITSDVLIKFSRVPPVVSSPRRRPNGGVSEDQR